MSLLFLYIANIITVLDIVHASNLHQCSHLKAGTQVAPHCKGPFHLLPSPGFVRCQLGDEDHEARMSCMQQCIRDSCCRAFGMKSGKCVTSVVTTYTLDYTKEVMVFYTSFAFL